MRLTRWPPILKPPATSSIKLMLHRARSPIANTKCCWRSRANSIRRSPKSPCRIAGTISEQLRRMEFDFNSEAARPYFLYDRVQQGILDVASRLFKVKFRPANDAVTWDPSVSAFDVFDGDRRLGRIYLDMHPRPAKDQWFSSDPIFYGKRGQQLPEATLICNFSGGKPGEPGLMEYGEVTTFFHEFGHLMHWIFQGQQRGRDSAATSRMILPKLHRRCSRSGCTIPRFSPPLPITFRLVSQSPPTWFDVPTGPTLLGAGSGHAGNSFIPMCPSICITRQRIPRSWRKRLQITPSGSCLTDPSKVTMRSRLSGTLSGIRLPTTVLVGQGDRRGLLQQVRSQRPTGT